MGVESSFQRYQSFTIRNVIYRGKRKIREEGVVETENNLKTVKLRFVRECECVGMEKGTCLSRQWVEELRVVLRCGPGGNKS